MNGRTVDHSALRTNQFFIVALLLTAFIGNAPWLVAFVGLVMIVGTIFPQAALFKAVYVYLLKPRGWLKPDVKADNPEPHLFAQGVGGTFLAVATIAFIAQLSVVGWALTWVVIALAALNLLTGICVGCMMYYWFHRLGVPGFKYARVQEHS